jgi:hypothetical protein
VKLTEVPTQPAAVGVTVTVPVFAVAPVLVAMNGAIFPEPEAPRPIEGLLFVQANVVPATGPPKATGVIVVPLHCDTPAMPDVTEGVGLTDIVNV